MDFENGLGLHSGRPIYHVDICAGSGMLGLGLKLALGGRLRTIAVVEREARAAALIVERMEEAALDSAPLWDDVTTCRESEFVEFVRQFDPLLVSAGYPCQAFSCAGKRLGANDERHLWPFILDFVRIAVPRYVFIENVAGHLSLGFDVVLGDLQAAGYDVACGLFTAAEVGASHERKRLFALAVLGDPEGAGRRLPDGRGRTDDTNGASGAFEAGKSGEILADADGVRLQFAPRPGISEIEIGSQPVEPTSKLCGLLLPARPDGADAGGAPQLADPGGAGRQGRRWTEPFDQRKSTVRIIPDDEMPMTEDGMVADVAISPAGTVSRGNPVQIAELALGKIAKATGKVYRLADFEDIEDIPEFVDQELRKHGIEPSSPVVDRKTGKLIYNGDGTGAANGSMWLMKLHHTSESKGSARGIGGYDAAGQPSKGGDTGAKRMAQGDLNALVAHGAYNTFLDAKYHRGQQNDEDYLQYMMGVTPSGRRKTPLIYQKFENSLKAAGINVKPDEDRLNIMAMTTREIDDLAGDREVNSGETLRWEKDAAPIGGGLFDPAIFGMDGGKWGKIKPVVPILNPVMEEPARILLGLKQKELKDVMSGKEQLGRYGGTGMQAIGAALGEIKPNLAITNYRRMIENSRGAQRDQAIRALGYLKACESTGVTPGDWMLDSIPVLPPKFRPVSAMKDSNVPLVDDANYLYKVLIDSNNGLKDLRKITRNTGWHFLNVDCFEIIS